jgi:hypothetical protein
VALLLITGTALWAGCKPDLPVDPRLPAGIKFLQVTGTWDYSASAIRLEGGDSSDSCEIAGVRVTLEQIEKAGAFTGRSVGGQMTCTGSLSPLSSSLVGFPISNGYTFDQFIAFDLGAPDWRHDGLVITADSVRVDSLSGSFRLDNGGLVFKGDFRMVRARK